MRRTTLITILGLVMLLALPGIAAADHPALGTTEALPGLSTGANQGGEDGVSFEILTSFPAGNSFTDHEFFSQDGEIMAAVGTLGGVGFNLAGQTIVQLTEGGPPSTGGAVDPSFLGAFPSSTCVTDFSAALGLQHDVEAAPKGITLLNEDNPFADRRDTQLILDATDAPGRCHDQGILGLSGVPQGGLEIVDVTDPTSPVELALTSHIGEAHTVNVDPKRPHIAYVVTSDSISVVTDADDCDADGDTAELIRQNECAGSADTSDLDGFEIVDYSSCMDLGDMSVEEKRAACQPETFRYRYESLDVSLGHTNLGTVYGCHELEVYPDDRLACGSGGALILLDMSGAFDANGTPEDFSDDTVNGTPLDCTPRASTTVSDTGTDALVHDCVDGAIDGQAKPLDIASWIADGAPGVEGVEWLGSAYHMGRETTDGAAMPAFASDEDIDFDHEAEFTHSGNFLLATDERGGGVTPPGATCTQGIDNPTGNGGVHAYATNRLTTTRPDTAEAAFDAYALGSDGEKAIYRTSVQTGGEVAFCTAHVFHQIPGQNRIFMAWYSQGTRVVDYVENPDGTIDFFEIAYFIPENTDQWASEVFDVVENEDGSYTYYGLTAETLEGRGTIDVFRADLPAPLQMADEVLSVRRIDASGPATTAAAISADTFSTGAGTVVLGREDLYADNLAGAPLAAMVGGPLLYTATDSLTEVTGTEIDRLGAAEVIVLGGPAAVSDDVIAELEAQGLTVRRIAGADRFETAALVAAEVGAPDGIAYIAEGENTDPQRGWPDPVALSALAAGDGAPILLASRDRLPSQTVGALDALGVTEAVIGGGTAAISDAVADQIAANGPTVRRVAGATRYETSLEAFRAQAASGVPATSLYLADGRDWPQALAAGPAAAVTGSRFAIVDGSGSGADTLTEVLRDSALELGRVTVVGSTDEIAASVVDSIFETVATERANAQPAAAGVTIPGGDVALLTGIVGLMLLAGIRRRAIGVR